MKQHPRGPARQCLWIDRRGEGTNDGEEDWHNSGVQGTIMPQPRRPPITSAHFEFIYLQPGWHLGPITASQTTKDGLKNPSQPACAVLFLYLLGPSRTETKKWCKGRWDWKQLEGNSHQPSCHITRNRFKNPIVWLASWCKSYQLTWRGSIEEPDSIARVALFPYF